MNATSVGGTLTGRGGNFIIIDDPIKPGAVMSAAERTSVNQWYENTVYSRLNVPNDDVIILVMQRVHVDDLIGHVLEKEEWIYLDIPAIAEERRVYDLGRGGRYTREVGEVLHDDRLNRAALDNIKANIGTYIFEAQYQQRPVPPGGALIKWAWFQTYDQVPDLSAFDLVVQSWDTASTVTQSSDYSVGTTWGVRGCDYYLLDVVRERLEFPALKRRDRPRAAEVCSRCCSDRGHDDRQGPTPGAPSGRHLAAPALATEDRQDHAHGAANAEDRGRAGVSAEGRALAARVQGRGHGLPQRQA